MNYKILIIENEEAILLPLKDELSLEYDVLISTTAKAGLEIADSKKPDLVLLDLMLGDGDGFDVCRLIKEKNSDISIIILTACDQLVDKIRGLESGADDYLTKPFHFQELKARITAVLRRRRNALIAVYENKKIKIDFVKNIVTKNKKTIKLSYLELNLLRFLVCRKPNPVSREDLLRQVWGYQVVPSTRTVDAHISSLRRKIGKGYIKSIHSKGYLFIDSD
ncbi:MAG: response regulator transcription factor [Candidatus Omnitrophica bacterium]|nr:response regulator transcription factor [Candidatus Omnitrophota bacterium]